MKPVYLRIVIAVCISIFFCQSVLGQKAPLTELTWQKRCVLLITDSVSNGTYQQQIIELGDVDADYEDRRLIVVDVRKDKYGFRSTPDAQRKSPLWHSDASLYQKYGSGQEGFRIVLIGLDGGIKLQQDEFVTKQALFDRIDAMPMRKVELRNKY